MTLVRRGGLWWFSFYVWDPVGILTILFIR